MDPFLSQLIALYTQTQPFLISICASISLSPNYLTFIHYRHLGRISTTFRQHVNTMLLDVPPRRILNRFFAEPLPPAGSFDGQTVVVTGGTAGIGLVAAIHFAKLGADVIITYRNASRGEAARRKIAESALAAGAKAATVTLMELDMSSYASCVAFVGELKKGCSGGVDVVVLNAGRISPNFETSPEGW